MSAFASTNLFMILVRLSPHIDLSTADLILFDYLLKVFKDKIEHFSLLQSLPYDDQDSAFMFDIVFF